MALVSSSVWSPSTAVTMKLERPSWVSVTRSMPSVRPPPNSGVMSSVWARAVALDGDAAAWQALDRRAARAPASGRSKLRGRAQAVRASSASATNGPRIAPVTR